MKVLHVVSSVAVNSGVAQVIMNYYRNMGKNVTFDFLIFGDTENSFRDEIEKLGGKIFVTGKPCLRSVFQYINKLDVFFEEHCGEYQAVHLHGLYLSSFILPMAKKHGIKVRIAHSHATKFSDYKLRAIRNFFLFFPVRFLATTFFACSTEAGKVAFGRSIVSSSNFCLVRNGIDVKRFEFSQTNRELIRKELGLKDDEFVVGNIGRFMPVKNHTFIIKVFYELLKHNPSARLMLTGDGVLLPKIKRRVLDYGLKDKVLFVKPRTDVEKLYSVMDVFLLPSKFEGLCNVLIEAQCNGLPCVVSCAIVNEAKILPNLTAMNLKNEINIWVRAIEHCDKERFYNACDLVRNAGFDIETEAEKMKQKYFELAKETTI